MQEKLHELGLVHTSIVCFNFLYVGSSHESCFYLQVIEMFQEVRRALLGDQAKPGNTKKFVAGSKTGGDPTSLFAEISNNSRYAQSIQNDIVKYDQIIKDLIKEIANFKASSMNHLLEFVYKTDSILDDLADETAVLKTFDWPKKYYTFREARALYEEMDKLRKKFKEWKRVPVRSIQDELSEMQKFAVRSKCFVFYYCNH